MFENISSGRSKKKKIDRDWKDWKRDVWQNSDRRFKKSFCI